MGVAALPIHLTAVGFDALASSLRTLDDEICRTVDAVRAWRKAKRRRASRGWRRHVRRLKASRRRLR